MFMKLGQFRYPSHASLLETVSAGASKTSLKYSRQVEPAGFRVLKSYVECLILVERPFSQWTIARANHIMPTSSMTESWLLS